MDAIKIEDYLLDLKSKGILYYIPNSGNAGDSFIALSTFTLFNKLKINYKLLDWESFDPKDSILVYGGGGNFTEKYHNLEKIIKKFHKSVKRFIILPQTISSNEKTLKELGPNVDIICREEVSYNHVKKYATKANIFIADDLTFNFDIRIFLNKKLPSLPKMLLKKTFYRIQSNKNKEELLYFPSFKQVVILYRKMPYLSIYRIFYTNKNTFNAFREDWEKTFIQIPKNNCDLSVSLQCGYQNEFIASHISYFFLKFINYFSQINTNRAHIAIAAAKMGKNVNFYPNNYYKKKAIYEFSMKDKFKNVKWIDKKTGKV